MKRIIQGRTYDTETAILVAENTQYDNGLTVGTALFQANDGVFFAVDEIEREHRRNGDWHTRISYEWAVLGDASEALRFCEERCLTIFENIEDVPPETGRDQSVGELLWSLRSTMVAESTRSDTSTDDADPGVVRRGREALDDQLANIDRSFARGPIAPHAPSAKVLAHPIARNLQQPALPGLAQGRARWMQSDARQDGGPTPLVRQIYRYPIKGLSPQPLSNVLMESRKPLPHDRIFALARPGAGVDREATRWAKKGQFVTLMLDEALAQVKTSLDVETLELTITSDNQQLMVSNLDDERERGKVEAFFHRLVPGLSEAPTLVRADGHFMNKSDNVISLINLATVRDLEERWGFDIDPLRFRANIYVDGARPWEESDWIGRDIRFGDVRCHVDSSISRGGAINVNPMSGRRDVDIPGALRSTFGHRDLGVYLITTKGGELRVGDPVTVPHGDAARLPPRAVDRVTHPGSRRYICHGCYYIYEESRGLPQQSIAPGTEFASLPMNWRCPDCGTHKMTFRPYIARGDNRPLYRSAS
jgi:GntR family transcriptional regulator / MocR family aminotransferase